MEDNRKRYSWKMYNCPVCGRDFFANIFKGIYCAKCGWHYKSILADD